MTFVPTCPARYCDSYGVLNGRLASEAQTDSGVWQVISGKRLGLPHSVSQKHFYSAACWSLTVAVPAALTPPHGLCVFSSSASKKPVFTLAQMESLHFYFLLTFWGCSRLSSTYPTVDVNSQFPVLSSVGLFSDRCIL